VTASDTPVDPPGPTLPKFGSGCVSDLMPTLLGHVEAGDGIPVDLGRPRSRVLVVLDGVGWEQLGDRAQLAPTLSAMSGGPITTVAPSTTATALTSITTGLTPAEHGVAGYRMMIDGEVLNTLRWGTKSRPDCRRTIPPTSLQPYDPFLGERVDYVSRAEFGRSGFTQAHLRGAQLHGYRTTAVMVHEIARLAREGAPFVYAYYDGVDKVSHEYGLGSVFDAEFAFADRLVADIIEAVPAGTEVLVTADHGQVDCGGSLLPIAREVLDLCTGLSGEARFRWLHAVPGSSAEIVSAALEHHGHQAWVVPFDQMIDESWFGPHMRPEVRDRYGDVALVPFEPVGFRDPDDTGVFELIGFHGSLTPAEMLVPLLIAKT